MAAAQSFMIVQQHSLKSGNHLYYSPQLPPHSSSVYFNPQTSFRSFSIECFWSNSSSSSNGNGGNGDSNRHIHKFGSPKTEIKIQTDENVSQSNGDDVDGGWFKSLWSVLSSRPSKTVISVKSGDNVSVQVSVSSTGNVVVDKPQSEEVTSAVGGASGVYVPMIGFAVLVLVLRFVSRVFRRGTDITSVLKLQIGLLGSAKSLQMDLNQIAETAETSTSKGLHCLLTETVQALVQHPDYCISTYSSTDLKRSKEAGEQRFHQLSTEERSKSDNEIFINVKNLRASGFSNEYKVMTILVAAGGAYKLRSINNRNDLKEALKKLIAIPSSKILAVDVLWTPRFEDDTLSKRELLEDYPLLRLL